MKLHKVNKSKSPVVNKPKAQARKSHENTLPSDDYQPIFDPIRFLSNTFENYSGEEVNDYLEVSVKRFNEDLENAPRFYISTYRESPKYTGYLKGKTISFQVEAIEELINALDSLNEQLSEMEEE